MPAEPIRDPCRQQQALHGVIAFHVDVELHHVGEGIAPRGGIEHHGERFSPAAQPQPVEIVHGLARINPGNQHIQAAAWAAQGGVDHQAPRQRRQSLQHVEGFVEAAVPPHPAGQVIAHQGLDQVKVLLDGPHAAPQHHRVATGCPGASLLRQGAVGRHHCFQGPSRIKGGGQGDQPPRHVGTDGAFHHLAPQVGGALVARLLA